MAATGLNRSTAGNVSVRAEPENARDGFLITPTGMPYDTLLPDDIVFMALDGTCSGPAQALVRMALPSRPLRRPAGGRRRAARALALRRQPRLPAPRHSALPLHDRPLRRRQHPLRRLRHFRHAGTVRRGAGRPWPAAAPACSPTTACWSSAATSTRRWRWAIELEALCEQYWRACQLGAPVLLDAAEMATVLEKFGSYGQQA